ncbi:uncharacterized protein BXZ73DRAFT_88499 [Epithele typhae]|uniref:uncharacterized protein n=1 Tax=Epithele typhae TaxID=378194 RepID=UPI002007FD7F|nr:uncharacterized protein BXZ73DRAFT_88499 [Epithele typhae]KAH9940773.1 hypothetical protein BXZ73DRAFT_88499 [Epithele typhae]
MTSRLKRKLNDLGVDTGSSKANESFCLIGTPLPPLEKSKDTGEFVPLWKQEVRDEKGRRRLHGAFTGGFSAGYFNTVGSKEGWTPAAFVSSRGDRAKARAVRPEDFMDEEDLAEVREGQKLVDETEEMDLGGTAAEMAKRGAGAEQDPIAAALAASLAPAPKDSVGARILKKMGWRPGHGVGPRLTHAQRKAQDAGFLDPTKEVTGAEAEDDVEEAKKHMYPRRDAPVLAARRKDNFHGLGYSPGMGLVESVSGSGGGPDAGPGGPRISAGFGLGALNDAEDDDVDVYDSAAGLASRRTVAFDSTLGEDDQHISIGSSSARRAAAQQPRAPPGITQNFNDGTPVLKGFVLSDKPVAEDRLFPLPDAPPGWQPNPKLVWDKGEDKENVVASPPVPPPIPSPAQPHAQWKANQLSADQRGALLGETPLPAKTRSVFDFLSQKDRERLQSFRARPDSDTAAAAPHEHPTTSPPPGPPLRAPGVVHVPPLHPSAAKAALSGFQPFAGDATKHARYSAFLAFRADAAREHAGADALGFGPLPGQTVGEFNKELDDYAKAATVFKPLSGAMADRFRTAVVVENGPRVVEGLHQPTGYAEDAGEDGEREKEKEVEDPKMGAVRLGMFGPLTREAKPWRPAKLLCKRFGVKEPEVDDGAQGAQEGGADVGAPDTPSASTSAQSVAMIAASEAESVGATAPGVGHRDLAHVGLGEDETQGRDTLTYERPAMDVFKAIFASDDEDSDDEGAGKGEGAGQDENIDGAPVEDDVDGAPMDVDGEKKAVPTPAPAPDGPVDLATFRPTEGRKEKEKGSEKSRRKERKKAKAALMSFEVEDDGSAPSFGPTGDRKAKDRDKDRDREQKKKKRKEEHTVDPPQPPPAAAAGRRQGSRRPEGGGQRGRKRAVDFM